MINTIEMAGTHAFDPPICVSDGKQNLNVSICRQKCDFINVSV
jgi:hypothetical protein